MTEAVLPTDEELWARRQFPLTDAGNAERFALIHGDRFRYAHVIDRWFVWRSGRWAPDDCRERDRRAVDTARWMYDDARKAPTKEEARKLAMYSVQSERRDKLEAMLALARSFPPISVRPESLDAEPLVLNLPNGTLDLATGRLALHRPAQLLTKQAPVPYEPNAEAPTWARFLERVVPDAEARGYLQRAAGYSLTGSISEHCLFFCYGTGANGKSTFLETLRDVLGEGEYAKAAAPDLLLAKRQDRHAAEIANLRGARFVTTIEVGEGRAWDESRVKWLTGGDTISARFLYGNEFSFQPTHKFWIAGNHKPRVHGTDYGFWRRVHFVPFTVTIPKEEQDPELRTKLQRELPGILRWAVDGCLAWRREGLRPPAAVLAATQAYRSSEDVLGAFIEECCTVDRGARVLVGALYDTFRAWADRGGEHAMTKRALGDALEERGFERRASNGQRWVFGLSLKPGVEQ